MSDPTSLGKRIQHAEVDKCPVCGHRADSQYTTRKDDEYDVTKRRSDSEVCVVEKEDGDETEYEIYVHVVEDSQ